jgi:hypothetical protein
MALSKRDKTYGAIFLAILIIAAISDLARDLSNPGCPCVHAPSSMETVPIYESSDATKEPLDFVQNGRPVKIVKWGIAATRVRFSDGREAYLPSEWVR